MIDAKKFSAAIRAGKKKLMNNDPEIMGTSPGPDYNASDIMDKELDSRMEHTLGTEPRIDADKTDLNNDDLGMGITPEQKKRMGRLKTYFDGLKLSED